MRYFPLGPVALASMLTALSGCASTLESLGVPAATAQRVQLDEIAAGQLVCVADGALITIPQINVIGATAAAVAAACTAAQIAGVLPSTASPTAPIVGAAAAVATVAPDVVAAVNASKGKV